MTTIATPISLPGQPNEVTLSRLNPHSPLLRRHFQSCSYSAAELATVNLGAGLRPRLAE